MSNRLREIIFLSFCCLIILSGCVSTSGEGGECKNRQQVKTDSLVDRFYWKPLSYLNVIEKADRDIDFSGPVRYRFFSDSVQSLAHQLPSCHYTEDLLLEPESLTVTIRHDACTRKEFRKRYQTPSFVVDYDAPIFDNIVKAIHAVYGNNPSLTELRDFTYEFISNKKSSLMFSFASVVARQKAGDCKAHAVFQTALARKFGYNSKVVLGYVVVPLEDNGWAVLGHAWSECFDQESGRWIGFDATKVRPTVDHAYIPIIEVEDEGPSYRAQLVKFIQHSVRRIEVVL